MAENPTQQEIQAAQSTAVTATPSTPTATEQIAAAAEAATSANAEAAAQAVTGAVASTALPPTKTQFFYTAPGSGIPIYVTSDQLVNGVPWMAQYYTSGGPAGNWMSYSNQDFITANAAAEVKAQEAAQVAAQDAAAAQAALGPVTYSVITGYPVIRAGETPQAGVIYAGGEYSQQVYRVNQYGSTEFWKATDYNPNVPAEVKPAPGPTGLYINWGPEGKTPSLSAIYEIGSQPYTPNPYITEGGFLYNPATGNFSSGGMNSLFVSQGYAGSGPWTGAMGQNQDFNSKVAQYTEGGTANPNYNPDTTPKAQGAAAIAELIAKNGGGQLQVDVAKLAIAEGYQGQVSSSGYVESASTNSLQPGSINTYEPMLGAPVYYTKEGTRKVADNAANIAEMISLNGGGQLDSGVAALAREEGAGKLIAKSGYVPSAYTEPASAPSASMKPVIGEPILTSDVTTKGGIDVAGFLGNVFGYGPLSAFIGGLKVGDTTIGSAFRGSVADPIYNLLSPAGNFVNDKAIIPFTEYIAPSTTTRTTITPWTAPESYFQGGGAGKSYDPLVTAYVPQVTKTTREDSEAEKALNSFGPTQWVAAKLNNGESNPKVNDVVATAGIAAWAVGAGELLGRSKEEVLDPTVSSIASKSGAAAPLVSGVGNIISSTGVTALGVVSSAAYIPVAIEWAGHNITQVPSKALAITTDMASGVVKEEAEHPGSFLGTLIGMEIGGKATAGAIGIVAPTIGGALPFEIGKYELPVTTPGVEATYSYFRPKTPSYVPPDFTVVSNIAGAAKGGITAVKNFDVLKVADETRTFVMDKGAPSLMPDVPGAIAAAPEAYYGLVERIPAGGAELRAFDATRTAVLEGAPNAMPDVLGGVQKVSTAVTNGVETVSTAALNGYERVSTAATNGVNTVSTAIANAPDAYYNLVEKIPVGDADLRAFDAARTAALEGIPNAIPTFRSGVLAGLEGGSELIRREPPTFNKDLMAFDSARQFVLDKSGNLMPDSVKIMDKLTESVDKIPEGYYNLVEKIPVGDTDLRLFGEGRTAVLDTIPDYVYDKLSGLGGKITNPVTNLFKNTGFYYNPEGHIIGFVRTKGSYADALLANAARAESLEGTKINRGQVPTWQTRQEMMDYFNSVEGKKGFEFWHATNDPAFIQKLIAERGITTDRGLYVALPDEIFARFAREGYNGENPALIRVIGERPKSVNEAMQYAIEEGQTQLQAATNPNLPPGVYPGTKPISGFGWEPGTATSKGHVIQGAPYQQEFIIPVNTRLSAVDISYGIVEGKQTPIVTVRLGEANLLEKANMAVKATRNTRTDAFVGNPYELLESSSFKISNPLQEGAKGWGYGERAIVDPYLQYKARLNEVNENAAVAAAGRNPDAVVGLRTTDFVQRELLGQSRVNEGVISAETAGEISRVAAEREIIGGGSEVVRANLGEAAIRKTGDTDLWPKASELPDVNAELLKIVEKEHPDAATALKPNGRPATFSALDKDSGLPIADIGIPGREKPIVGMHSIEGFPEVPKDVTTMTTVGGHENIVRTTNIIGRGKLSAMFDDQFLTHKPGGILELSMNERNIKHAVGASTIAKEAASLKYGRDSELTGMEANYAQGAALEKLANSIDAALKKAKDQETVIEYQSSIGMNPLELPETKAAKIQALAKEPIAKMYSGIPLEIVPDETYVAAVAAEAKKNETTYPGVLYTTEPVITEYPTTVEPIVTTPELTLPTEYPTEYPTETQTVSEPTNYMTSSYQTTDTTTYPTTEMPAIETMGSSLLIGGEETSTYADQLSTMSAESSKYQLPSVTRSTSNYALFNTTGAESTYTNEPHPGGSFPDYYPTSLYQKEGNYPSSTYPSGNYSASMKYPSGGYPSASTLTSGGKPLEDLLKLPVKPRKETELWQMKKPKKLKTKPHVQTFEYAFDPIKATALQQKALGLNVKQTVKDLDATLFYRTGKNHQVLGVIVPTSGGKVKPGKYPTQKPLGINIPTVEYYRTTGKKGIAEVASNAVPFVISSTAPKNHIPKSLLGKKKKHNVNSSVGGRSL